MLKKILQKTVITTLIISWVFSPIIPVLPVPFSNEEIQLGPQMNVAQAAFGNGYEYRRSITIDPTQVSGASNLTDFPVLVSFASPTLATTGNGGNVTNASGFDIIFTSDSAGTTQLDHEIERYVNTGEITMWVRVPTLDTTSNTVIYMFYGNSSVSTTQEDIVGTWDADYEAVLHLSETSGQHLDSTSNNNDSTSVSVTTQGSAAGKIAGADDFNGTSNSVTIADSATLDITNTGTIEAWMRADDVSTRETPSLLWKTIATSTLTGASASTYSSVDSVVVGEKIYYGAIMCNAATETFYTATSTLDGSNFSVWTSRTAPNGCASTGGGSIAVDFNGKELWYAVMASDAAGVSTFSYATSTTALTSFSAWKTPGNITANSAGATEGSAIDMVITGNKAYFAALALSNQTEAFFTANINLDGSTWSGWTNQADPNGGGADEACGISINTDGIKLYYTANCYSTAASTFQRSSSRLDGASLTAWTSDTSPTGAGAADFGFIDSVLVNGYSYHSAFLHADTVTAFNVASSSPEGGSVTTWRAIKAANGDPDGAGAIETTDPSVESDGKNLFYSAFAHNGTLSSFFIASSTLPAHPFVSKLNAYEMIQGGLGYTFDWVGKPSTFGTTTVASTFQHVAVTLDGTTMDYYIDGALVGSTTVSTDFESNANALLVGSGFRADGTQIYFDGIIDEVRISSTARSTDWIATQYNNQNSTSTFYTIGAETPSEVADPLIFSSQSQKFVIGQASTPISSITIKEGTFPTINATDNILIAISTTTGFGMEWDTTDTSASIGGTASGKVSATVSYLGPTILRIDVTSAFSTLDTLTIAGLSYRNFTAPAKSGLESLRLYAGGTASGLALATSTTLVTITSNDSVPSLGKPPNYLRTGANLTAYYPFDGSFLVQNVSDISGNGNNGMYIAGAGANTATTTGIGKIGQAFDFDGTDDYIAASSDYISTGAETITAWIRPRSLGEGSTGRILDNGQVRFYVSSSNTISFSSDNGSTVANSAASAFTLNNGWTFVAVTRLSDGTANIYVNGTLSGSANQSSGSPAAGSAVHIGNNSATTATFDGLIDDVRVYARDLTAEEIGLLSRIGGAKTGKISTPSNLQGSLVGYWSFDGKTLYTNVGDSSGQGNNGKLIVGGAGNTSTTTVPGKIGQALNFDGGTDYIDLDNPSAVGLTQFTIAAWFKRKGAGVTVGTGTGGLTGTTLAEPIVTKLVAEQDGTTQDGNYFLGVVPATMRLGADFESTLASNNNNPIIGSTTVSNDIWNHAVFTFDGSNRRLYLNGVADGAALPTTQVPRSDSIQQLTIGSTIDSTGVVAGFWNGDIDEVRIYSKALSATEVRQLFNSGQAKSKP